MFQNIKNEVDFWLRRQIKWSRARFSKKHLNALTTPNIITSHASLLLADFPEMRRYADYMPEYQWLENLNLLSLLNQISTDASFDFRYEPDSNNPIRILEVGVKNWSTLPASVSFLKAKSQCPIELTGIELDLWRVYANGKSRFDALQENISLVSQLSDNCMLNWLEGDVCKLSTAPFDVVFCFLPFVFEEPHLKWGLPQRYFNPKAFFQKLSQLVSPEGYLILCNQGEAEFKAQGELLSSLNLVVKKAAVVSQPFLELKHARYAWLLQQTIQPIKLH